MGWDSDTDDRLRTKWTQGLPTRQIASDLGTTNGAVAGRARRLALPFRSGPRASAGHSAFSKREAKKRRAAKKDNPFGSSKVFERAFRRIEEKMLAADAGRVGVPLLIVKDGLLHANPRLGSNCCKWPIHGGFCGVPSVLSSSYCAAHLARSVPAGTVIAGLRAVAPPPRGQLLLFGHLEPIARKFEAA